MRLAFVMAVLGMGVRTVKISSIQELIATRGEIIYRAYGLGHNSFYYPMVFHALHHDYEKITDPCFDYNNKIDRPDNFGNFKWFVGTRETDAFGKQRLVKEHGHLMDSNIGAHHNLNYLFTTQSEAVAHVERKPTFDRKSWL